MDFVDKNIEKYVEALSDKESPLLKEINEYTSKNVHQPNMLSGHLLGRILSFISKVKNPKYILEIGTYTGYSALCLAEGLDKKGILHTIDENEELIEFQKKYFDKSPYKNKIIQHLGKAESLVGKMDGNFDLALKPVYLKCL